MDIPNCDEWRLDIIVALPVKLVFIGSCTYIQLIAYIFHQAQLYVIIIYIVFV